MSIGTMSFDLECGNEGDVVEDSQEELPSLGSHLHSAGECRPCAWFHKPQGCSNGAECRHCHLCGDGEIKTRKKSKVAGLRTASKISEISTPEEKTTPTSSSVVQPPPGLATPEKPT